jgi:hypothetical protein
MVGGRGGETYARAIPRPLFLHGFVGPRRSSTECSGWGTQALRRSVEC